MRLPVLLSLLAIFAIPFAASARAELKITEADRVVFAYFELNNRTPDYKYWAEGTQAYAVAKTKDDKEMVLGQEEFRLDWGFNQYDVKKDFLRLRTPVMLTLNKKDNQTRLEFQLLEILDPAQPFFPFPYGHELIGLYIKDLPKFKSIPLNPKDRERIEPLFKDRKEVQATLSMHVRPLEGNDVSPLVIEETNVWLLTGDLAYLAIEEKNKREVLMSYSAPWYLSDDEKALIDILE